MRARRMRSVCADRLSSQGAPFQTAAQVSKNAGGGLLLSSEERNHDAATGHGARSPGERVTCSLRIPFRWIGPAAD
jgi:hypothetical protein